MQGSTLSAPTRVDGDHRLAYHPGTTRQEEATTKGPAQPDFHLSRCKSMRGRWQVAATPPTIH